MDTDVRTRTQNITSTFRKASQQDRTAGRDWYRRARRLAEELDPGHVERAAAVIAVLSPRLSWEKNVELARLAYRWHAERGDLGCAMSGTLAAWPGLRTNALKAFRILGGEDPDDVVAGPKVRAFWHTIVDPSDPRAVVVDRHAIDVAAGRVLDDKVRGHLLGRKGAYDALSDQYRRAARVLSKETGEDWSPAEVQAVTWSSWRDGKRGGMKAAA
jgi:hypothetical protein